MTCERATAAADQLAAVNEEAIAFALACSDAQWRTLVPGEEWTVGVVLHHIADGHARATRWLQAMVKGEAVTETAHDIDTLNDEHTATHAGVSVDEVVTLLRHNGLLAETTLRTLTHEELDRMAPFGPAGGQELPAGDLAPVFARHAAAHLAHARDALG